MAEGVAASTPSGALQLTVTETIKNAGTQTTVLDRVISHYVGEEIQRRAKLIIEGYGKLKVLEKEIAKVKPDLVSYSPDGTVFASNYSKGKVEELKKLNERQTKLRGALDAAIEKADFTALDRAVSDKGGEKKGEGNDEA